MFFIGIIHRVWQQEDQKELSVTLDGWTIIAVSWFFVLRELVKPREQENLLAHKIRAHNKEFAIMMEHVTYHIASIWDYYQSST